MNSQNQNNRTFSILSSNIKMLPGLAGKGDKDIKRAKKIVKKILEKNYSLICFQELFDEDVRKLVSKRLKSAYPFQIKKSDDGNIFQQDSGLFMASKFPFFGEKKSSRFDVFNACSGTDCFAEKGIVAVRYNLNEIKNGFNLIILNTHLQSDGEHVGENEKIRTKQLKQIRKFLKSILLKVNDRKKTGVLLTGDMNIDGSTLEWIGMKKILEYPRDLYPELNDVVQHPGYTWDYKENKNMIPRTDRDQLRLDYIFAIDHIPVKDEDGDWDMANLNVQSCNIQNFGTEKNNRLSDHFALEAKVVI